MAKKTSLRSKNKTWLLISCALILISILLLNSRVLNRSVKGASTAICGGQKYFSCLKDQFDITTKGTGDNNIGQSFFWSLALPFSYPQYLNYFKQSGITITVSNQHDYHGAWARTDPEGKNIILYQAFFKDASTRYQRYVLIHEAAHTVGNSNDYLQQNLYKQVHDAGLDKNCFYKGVLKTYPTNLLAISSNLKRSQIHETFAEAVADTIICGNNDVCPSNGGGGQNIKNFPTACPHIFSYINKYVLGPFVTPTQASKQ